MWYKKNTERTKHIDFRQTFDKVSFITREHTQNIRIEMFHTLIRAKSERVGESHVELLVGRARKVWSAQN